MSSSRYRLDTFFCVCVSCLRDSFERFNFLVFAPLNVVVFSAAICNSQHSFSTANMKDPTLLILSKVTRESCKPLNYNLQLPRGRNNLKSNLIVDFFSLLSPLTLSSGKDKHNNRQLSSKGRVLEIETKGIEKEFAAGRRQTDIQDKTTFRKAGI